MVERHFYRFSSVDFFGKSMPGVLFTLFGVLFLPEPLYTSVVSFVDAVNLAVVVSAFFIIVVVGFTAGQGINIVAIILQRVLYTTGYLISEIARNRGFPDYEYWAEVKFTDSTKDGSGKSAIVLNFKYWIWNRYVNIKRGLVPHRIIFNDWIRRHISPNRPDGNEPKIETFIEKYDAHSSAVSNKTPSIPTPSPSQHINDIDVPEDVYLLVSDYVSHHGPVRSRRHKALFVFCRNTAIALALYTILVTVVALDVAFESFHLLTPEFDTVLANLIHNEILAPSYVLPSVLFGSTFIFIYAIGIYKKMYLEYLIMDFISHYHRNEGRSSQD